MKTYNLPPLDLNQRYTIPEAAQYLRISRAYLYQLIQAGEVQTVKDGRRIYVPGSVIAERSRVAA